ncbi:MAG: hypothetical protein IPG71_03870 [bacterium]|nr:hypothetical protein [bacterium]
MILSPGDALKALRDGSDRYVAEQPAPWRAGATLRSKIAHTQEPFACVVTCSDSRVAPEIVFDQTHGDLFVIRVAGTILTPEVVGSVEFAVEALGVKLIVVMAHSGCGAIEAAVSDLPLRGAVSAVIARLGTIVIEKEAGAYGRRIGQRSVAAEHAQSRYAASAAVTRHSRSARTRRCFNCARLLRPRNRSRAVGTLRLFNIFTPEHLEHHTGPRQ